MTTLSKKALAYLRLIGKTREASVVLTRGYSKQAAELKRLGLAVFISIAAGGYHVALTQAGLDTLDEEEES
jgi:hypothetical protein